MRGGGCSRTSSPFWGMIILIIIVIAALIGPAIITRATGMPMISFPKSGSYKVVSTFSRTGRQVLVEHPMGTDNAGRDILARVLSGGQISLMVALIATLVSL